MPLPQPTFTRQMARRRRSAHDAQPGAGRDLARDRGESELVLSTVRFRPTSSSGADQSKPRPARRHATSRPIRSSSANRCAPTTSSGGCAAFRRHRRAASRWRRCSASLRRAISRLCRRSRSTASLEPQPDAVHLFAEAGRLAFADRGLYVADAISSPSNVAGLLDPAYLKQRAQLISDRSMGIAKAGAPPGTRTGSGSRHVAAQSPQPHTSRWSTATATRCR